MHWRIIRILLDPTSVYKTNKLIYNSSDLCRYIPLREHQRIEIKIAVDPGHQILSQAKSGRVWKNPNPRIAIAILHNGETRNQGFDYSELIKLTEQKALPSVNPISSLRENREISLGWFVKPRVDVNNEQFFSL